MNKPNSKYFNSNNKYSKINIRKKTDKEYVEFRILEDKEDLTEIRDLASQATSKGFARAKKVAHEIVMAQNGKIVRKRPGKPNQIILKLEERKVQVGQTMPLEF
ncbi:hypothetical protein C9994_06210 [Marivirga lumbricoides]|uniref:Uncharacterized protein n=1 Tax=Marivirga lumbricoides TaxID=1046115 RepID=A0A2T4DS67_9BACT|nr:hypothetical protein C9994_06210 [Marivirga lumbricoides]